MHLGNLFMSLTLVRLEGDGLTVAAAGMPPILVYRAARGAVEQLILKGMPLGAFHDFPYRQAVVSFHPRDVLLLMTDGLPELFNDRREMLGMERVQLAFLEVAERSPEEIIAHLRSVGEAWQTDCPQEDDVTLLVLKATAIPDP
jgi:sigma-B regulation protein RsbU (phosphoserine phosphatase)